MAEPDLIDLTDEGDSPNHGVVIDLSETPEMIHPANRSTSKPLVSADSAPIGVDICVDMVDLADDTETLHSHIMNYDFASDYFQASKRFVVDTSQKKTASSDALVDSRTNSQADSGTEKQTTEHSSAMADGATERKEHENSTVSHPACRNFKKPAAEISVVRKLKLEKINRSQRQRMETTRNSRGFHRNDAVVSRLAVSEDSSNDGMICSSNSITKQDLEGNRSFHRLEGRYHSRDQQSVRPTGEKRGRDKESQHLNNDHSMKTQSKFHGNCESSRSRIDGKRKRPKRWRQKPSPYEQRGICANLAHRPFQWNEHTSTYVGDKWRYQYRRNPKDNWMNKRFRTDNQRSQCPPDIGSRNGFSIQRHGDCRKAPTIAMGMSIEEERCKHGVPPQQRISGHQQPSDEIHHPPSPDENLESSATLPTSTTDTHGPGRNDMSCTVESSKETVECIDVKLTCKHHKFEAPLLEPCHKKDQDSDDKLLKRGERYGSGCEDEATVGNEGSSIDATGQFVAKTRSDDIELEKQIQSSCLGWRGDTFRVKGEITIGANNKVDFDDNFVAFTKLGENSAKKTNTIDGKGAINTIGNLPCQNQSRAQLNNKNSNVQTVDTDREAEFNITNDKRINVNSCDQRESSSGRCDQAAVETEQSTSQQASFTNKDIQNESKTNAEVAFASNASDSLKLENRAVNAGAIEVNDVIVIDEPDVIDVDRSDSSVDGDRKGSALQRNNIIHETKPDDGGNRGYRSDDEARQSTEASPEAQVNTCGGGQHSGHDGKSYERAFVLIMDSSEDEIEEVHPIKQKRFKPIKRRRTKNSNCCRARSVGRRAKDDPNSIFENHVFRSLYGRNRSSSVSEGSKGSADSSSDIPKPCSQPKNTFSFQKQYSYGFSNKDALEMQERLFRESAARVRTQTRFRVVSNVSKTSGLTDTIGFESVMADVHKKFPDHWKSRDYFTRLGLPQNAPLHAVKSQYRILALIYHPDKSKSENTTAKFQAITEAYRALSGR